MRTQEDDTPLYLFDHCFGDYPSTRSLLEQYTVPSLFGQDVTEKALQKNIALKDVLELNPPPEKRA